MSYKIRQQWLPANKYSIKAPHSMKAEYITVHNTANDASAKNEANYMLSNNNQVSYHVAIDDVESVEMIPFSRNAWHAGDGANGAGNRKSIGIEICYSKSGGDRYKKAEKNAIEYIAHVLIQLGLKPDRVRYHKQWSGKNCPHRIIAEGREESFKDAIEKRYDELKNPEPVAPKPKPKPVAPPEPKDDMYRVKVDGKQVGAYANDKNVLAQVDKALKADKKRIEVERV